MSYIRCPKCEQKALSVATRCPRCGLAFELSRTPEPAPRRVPVGLIVAGVGVVLLVAVTGKFNFGSPPITRRPAMTEGETPPPRKAPPAPASAAPADTPRTVTAPPPAPAPAPQRAAVTAPPKDSAPVVVAPPRPEPAGTLSSQRRYASTWMNVRADRSRNAAVMRILRPGEPVLVDRLEQGWYRVVSEGEEPGYVDRRLLEESPPGETP